MDTFGPPSSTLKLWSKWVHLQTEFFTSFADLNKEEKNLDVPLSKPEVIMSQE